MSRDAHLALGGAARPLAFVVAAVVIGFVGSLWASQRPFERIGFHAEDIAVNASPNIERLAAARTGLSELAAAAGEMALRGAHADALLEERLESARREVETAIGHYLALPSTEEERERTASLPGELRALDDALAVVVAPDAGGPAARADALRRFHARLAAVDASLRTLVELNAGGAARQAAQIQSARGRARDIALGLGGVSVFAALVGTVLAARAIRMQHRLAAEHSRLLQERARELEAFAGRVAHDLRNPLSAMSLRVKAARKHPGAAEAALPKLDGQIQQMGRIIEGLLDFARAGARPRPGQRAMLAAVLGDVVASEREAARAHGIDLTFAALPDVEVACAPGALISIAGNLLRNAVKYVVEGPAERPRVTVRALELGERVRVEVEDNGPGIPDEDRERIFEPFARSATQQAGIGLGLATVRRIVEAYGGRVGVDAVPAGHGSSFWFELPRAAAGAQPEAAGTSATGPSAA
jgi:signal transduction histidine kinase